MTPLHTTDKTVIHLTTESEANYWMKHFSCERQDIHNAILIVGNNALLVEDFLSGKVLKQWKNSLRNYII